MASTRNTSSRPLLSSWIQDSHVVILGRNENLTSIQLADTQVRLERSSGKIHQPGIIHSETPDSHHSRYLCQARQCIVKERNKDNCVRITQTRHYSRLLRPSLHEKIRIAEEESESKIILDIVPDCVNRTPPPPPTRLPNNTTIQCKNLWMNAMLRRIVRDKGGFQQISDMHHHRLETHCIALTLALQFRYIR